MFFLLTPFECKLFGNKVTNERNVRYCPGRILRANSKLWIIFFRIYKLMPLNIITCNLWQVVTCNNPSYYRNEFLSCFGDLLATHSNSPPLFSVSPRTRVKFQTMSAGTIISFKVKPHSNLNILEYWVWGKSLTHIQKF